MNKNLSCQKIVIQINYIITLLLNLNGKRNLKTSDKDAPLSCLSLYYTLCVINT